jgi:hypothetical protein
MRCNAAWCCSAKCTAVMCWVQPDLLPNGHHIQASLMCMRCSFVIFLMDTGQQRAFQHPASDVPLHSTRSSSCRNACVHAIAALSCRCASCLSFVTAVTQARPMPLAVRADLCSDFNGRRRTSNAGSRWRRISSWTHVVGKPLRPLSGCSLQAMKKPLRWYNSQIA